MKHKTCAFCGANLDFGETCDCQRRKGEEEMGKTTITISLNDYNELVRASERIAAAERLIKATKYVTAQDIAQILNIEREEPYEY